MTVLDIARQFVPSATHVEAFGLGLLHTTYRVTSPSGDFVLQRLHDIVSDRAVHDANIVGSFLMKRGIASPQPLPAVGGDIVFHTDGLRFRCYPMIPGNVFDHVATQAIAREAGRLVGRFHAALQDCAYEPQGSIPNFHDTACVLEQLRDARKNLHGDIADIADEILEQLPRMIIDAVAMGEGEMIIHADLKISNLLFDDNGVGTAIVDMDTLMRHYRAIDLGDAFRSWCVRGTGEDDATLSFDQALFDAACEGYGVGIGGDIDITHRQLFLRATVQMAWELAARFLCDSVHDESFSVDRERYPTRREHNIARARGQFHLGQTILAHMRA